MNLPGAEFHRLEIDTDARLPPLERTTMFPTKILERYATGEILFYGRISTMRNDGCYFVVSDNKEGKWDSVHVAIHSPHESNGYEVVDNDTINEDSVTYWLMKRRDW